MYSLTFCIRTVLPERQQWKPAVQTAAVMLRTLPVDVPYMARNFENAPVTHHSAASSARKPRPDGRSHYVVISRHGRNLITKVRFMLP